MTGQKHVLCLIAMFALTTMACDKPKAPKTTPKPPAKTTKDPVAKAPKTKEKTTPPKVEPVKEPKLKPKFKKLTTEQKAQVKSQRDQYKKALRDGQKLVQSKKYDEGIKQLHLALKANPSSSQALGELGWAYFKKGEMAQSRMYTLRGLRQETSPNKIAAMYYNLGRVEEAEKRPMDAKKYYAQSLALRENNTVQKRFDALAKLKLKPNISQDLLAACRKVALQEWACAPKADEKNEIEKCDCKVTKQLTPTDGKTILDTAIVSMNGNIGAGGGSLDGSLYLAIKTKTGGWQLVTALTDDRTPGVSYLSHQGQLLNYAFVPQTGSESALIIRTHQRNDDGNYADNSTDYDVEKNLLICKSIDNKPMCWRATTYSGSGTEAMLDDPKEPQPKATFSFWSLDYALTKDAKVIIKKKSASLPKNAITGTFDLKALISKQGTRIPLQ